MNLAIVCTCALAALVLGLGMNVSRLRGERQRAGLTQFPDDPADPLFKAVRAHGNAAEYVPVLAILMLVVAAPGPAAWVRVVMVLATASRLLHSVAVFVSPSMAVQTPLRFGAALGTYVFGLVLVVAALLTI